MLRQLVQRRTRELIPNEGVTTTLLACASEALRNGIWPSPKRPPDVSADHLPPTSTPRTTRRDLAPGPTNSGYLRSFLRRATTKATPSASAAPRLAEPSPRRATDQSGINGQLDACMQWQSVNDDFQAPPISCRDPNKVQFPDQNICRNTTACFTANSCHHAFQSVTPFAQNPCPCARCAVMAKRVE